MCTVPQQRLTKAAMHTSQQRHSPAANAYLYFGQQVPLGQACFQLQQLRVSAGLVGPGVNTLICWASVRESALPLQGGIHSTAVAAVLIDDVRLVGPIWVALQPLSILDVQDGTHPLPEPHSKAYLLA